MKTDRNVRTILCCGITLNPSTNTEYLKTRQAFFVKGFHLKRESPRGFQAGNISQTSCPICACAKAASSPTVTITITIINITTTTTTTTITLIIIISIAIIIIIITTIRRLLLRRPQHALEQRLQPHAGVLLLLL